MSMQGLNFNSQEIIYKMPRLGDQIVQTTGELKDNFEVIKEYEYFYLGKSVKYNVREAFSKVSIALNEHQIIRGGKIIINGN